MLMKKLSEEHYIVMGDSEIKEGDCVYQQNFEKTNNQIISIKTEFQSNVANDKNGSFTKRKITHSTQPLGFLNEHGFTTANLKPDWTNVEYLPLSEVKELLGIVDVEKKALEISPVELDEDEFDVNETHRVTWIDGYTQAIEDNKEKKYTEEDMVEAYKMGLMKLSDQRLKDYMLPKTEWEVEFVDGKLKLKS